MVLGPEAPYLDGSLKEVSEAGKRAQGREKTYFQPIFMSSCFGSTMISKHRVDMITSTDFSVSGAWFTVVLYLI